MVVGRRKKTPAGRETFQNGTSQLNRGTNIVNLKTKIRQVDGIAVVDVSGRVTLGEETKLLRETIQGLLGAGQKEILLNLGEVSFIDSAGIGELVSAFTSVRNRGGELKLLKLTKRVRDVLQITKLYTVFDIRDDEAAAIKSFPTRIHIAGSVA
jgi:anti-sigma B factor antagonist